MCVCVYTWLYRGICLMLYCCRYKCICVFIVGYMDEDIQKLRQLIELIGSIYYLDRVSVRLYFQLVKSNRN